MNGLSQFFLVALHAFGVQAAFRSASTAQGFVKSLEFNHKLRVCNAYPHSMALDIFKGKQKLTNAPMHYKSCKDFQAPLQSGDKLDFKIGMAGEGTFSVQDLPQNDAVLLLIIHRHDQVSTAVSFESHVFASLENAQIAVIDTYKGAAMASPRIKDHEDAKKKKDQSRSEELRYSSIVAVNPGVYEVELDGTDGAVKATKELVALNHESYIVLRTGVEAKTGQSFPQELVVFPNSDPSALHSNAAAKSLLVAFATAVAAMFA